ncbi:MAG: hypothetical protein O3A00_18775 [Planctomycetota bacterium]|nr:hypothetical protein [Planctomycetota bacterium]
MSTEQSTPRSSQSPSSLIGFLKIVGIPVGVVVALILWLKLSIPQIGGITPGNESPQIAAAGWLNGDAPKPDELRGKVVVVHGWFDL